ncbi:hypothetical protein DPMN_118480 [Dreissena polymorpha]|uniref:Uncharacterized protein n=1 Tax=Dreissena polymorpha TaxID=45954 RepID=A0A9D4GH11_DREPO|nr:hypothetical protein DPMN_118480 [Dreissena polymorpha]
MRLSGSPSSTIARDELCSDTKLEFEPEEKSLLCLQDDIATKLAQLALFKNPHFV